MKRAKLCRMQKNEACTCNNIITVSVDSVNGVGREKRSAEGLGRPFIGEILAEIKGQAVPVLEASNPVR